MNKNRISELIAEAKTKFTIGCKLKAEWINLDDNISIGEVPNHEFFYDENDKDICIELSDGITYTVFVNDEWAEAIN